MCLSLTSKPTKSNSITDILLFAAPFVAITGAEKLYGWGNSYPEPDFNALSNFFCAVSQRSSALVIAYRISA